MRKLRALLVRFWGTLYRDEGGLNNEIEAHLQMHVEDNLRAGMTPANARREAVLKLGGIEPTKEAYRERRILPLLDQFVRDIRYAVRQLRRSPGFTLTAVTALGLGIGAVVAVFTVVDAVVLRPLPLPDRLVMAAWANADQAEEAGLATLSPAMFAHWRNQSSVIEYASVFSPEDEVMNYTAGAVVEQWRSGQVTRDVFRCLGMPLLLGRTFSATEDLPGGPKVAILGADLWTKRFGRDPGVIGKSVDLNGDAYTVVGVTQESPGMAEFGPPTDVWIPAQLDPNSRDHGQHFMAMALLKPGVTLEQAKARLQSSTAEFNARFPNVMEPKTRFTLAEPREFFIGEARNLLALLFGAVVLVLLIACANVANLLLVRGAGRTREIGIRVAIGAGRGRVVRQLLTESMLLSLVGGALGLWLGYEGIRALLASNTADMMRVGDNGTAVNIDWRLLIFSLGISLLAGIIFGVFPSLRASRVDVNSILKNSSGRGSTGWKQNKSRAVLVVSEVSLAVILLVGSALLIRTFVELHRVDRGFDAKNVVTMKIVLAGSKFAKTSGVTNSVRTGLEHIRAIPGVEAASAGCCIPLKDQNTITFDIAGQAHPAELYAQTAGWTTVWPGYFDVFRIPVKRGRAFDKRDDTKGPPVVVINETMAKQYWKDRDPIGDRIVIGRNVMKEFKDEPARQIVGIVADVRDTGLANAPRPIMYVPQEQLPDAASALVDNPLAWVVRTRDNPRKLASSIQEELRKATGLPASDLLLMDEVVSLSTARERFAVLLMTVFSSCALVLAAIGIYGLMAYTVEQRTQEIGIRIALGAEAVQVRNMVLQQGMLLTLAGVTIGIAAAWGLARSIESLLFNMKARDPLVFTVVPVLLTIVALLAIWIPARRALRVDPAEALRYE